MKKKCKACLGYGFWSWHHIAPMGSMDAHDGVPTTKCPECGANPNPGSSKERYQEIKEVYDKGLLRFGEAKDNKDFQAIWLKINKGKYV